MASAKHLKNYESYLEYSEDNRMIFARSCTTWVLENMTKTARGGAQSGAQAASSSQIPPTESSSDGGGLDEDVGYCNSSDDFEELQEWLEQQYVQAQDKEGVDDRTLARELQLLMGEGVPDDGCGSAANDRQDFRNDNDEDFGEERCRRIEIEDTVPFSPKQFSHQSAADCCMFVKAGNRLLRCRVCEHIPATQLIASIGIIMRQPTSSTVLVRDAQLVVDSSGPLSLLDVEGAGWQACRLPLAPEFRSYNWDGICEPDDTIDERCIDCGGCNKEKEEEVQQLTAEEETAAMQECDHDVIVLSLKRARDQLSWQARKGIRVAELQTHYAAVKRVKLSHVRIHYETPLEDRLDGDASLSVMVRGGTSPKGQENLDDGDIFFVIDHVRNQQYMLRCNHTAGEMLHRMGKDYGAIWYRGAQLDPDVPMQRLRVKAISLLPHRIAGTPQLRTLEQACASGYMHMIEVSEWWLTPGMGATETRMVLADLANRLDDARTRQALMRRGGAPKGRLPWESSHSVKGMRLAFPCKHGEDPIPEIDCDKICDGCTGICFILLANWQKVIAVTSDKPLVFILPGKCANIVRKLGADMSKVSEDTMLLKDADGTAIIRRTITMIKASDHEITTAAELQSVSWKPAASVELIAELDSRWAASVVLAEAEKDWRRFLTNCLSKFAMETYQASDVFGCRLVQQEPYRLWQGRIRTSPEATERLLAASGRDACFLRPQQPQNLPQANGYTIVWAKRNSDASTTELAHIRKTTEAIAGHRGLARSTSSIGARIPWSAVKEIRQTLLPGDSRFNAQTVGLKDNKVFAMQGVPMGARDAEVARFCKDIGWASIPMRRIPNRSSATWWITAENPPTVPAAKWADSTVLIEEVPEEQRYKSRGGDKKDTRKQREQTGEKSAPKVPMADAQASDKLVQQDPWARYAAQSSGGSQSSSKPPPVIAMELPADPRLQALTTRMDAVEADQRKLNGKVDGIDCKLTSLNSNIAEQFQNVMAGLAQLQSAQAEEAKRAKKS